MNSQSFTNLLNEDFSSPFSQDNYESFSENLSQSPAQIFDYSNMEEHGSSQKKGRTKSFSSEEDIMLIFAYLNVSIDPIHGNDKKSTTYWNRIHEYFHEHIQVPSDRNANSLMNHWSTIQLAVGKFQGYYNQIEGLNQSGNTEQNKVIQTQQMYKNFQRSAFHFIHCWNELRHCPKWKSQCSQKRAKTSKKASPGSYFPSSENLDNLRGKDDISYDLERSMGRKRAKELKRKTKGKETNNTSVEDVLQAIRDEQHAERLARDERHKQCLKLEKLKEEREQRKEEREQLLYEERIISIDTTKMSHVQAEYYNRLQTPILEKLSKSRDSL